MNRRSSERGSVVIAMSVMMILLLLGVALVTRSQTQLSAAAGSSDAAAAEAGAEQGIAEAIARLDGGERGDFSGAGVLPGGSYSFTASRVSATSYLVEATGDVDGVVRAVDVNVGGETLEQYTLFIDTKASIIDNDRAITGRVGTNGPISVRGTPPGDSVDLFGPGASCTSCPTTTTFPDRRIEPSPEVPTGATRTCPRNGVFSGVIDGRNGVPYVCDRGSVSRTRVSFTSSITVINGPLIIYVRTGLDVRFTNAIVNAGNDPSNFQLSAEGDDDYWWFDAWNSRITGELYAPGRDSILGNVDLVGSMSIGVLSVPAGYDAAMSPFGGASGGDVSGWVVTSWERVATR